MPHGERPGDTVVVRPEPRARAQHAALHHLARVESRRDAPERLDGERGVPVGQPIAVARTGKPRRTGDTVRGRQRVQPEQPLVHAGGDGRAQRVGDRLDDRARPGHRGRCRIEIKQRVDDLTALARRPVRRERHRGVGLRPGGQDERAAGRVRGPRRRVVLLGAERDAAEDRVAQRIGRDHRVRQAQQRRGVRRRRQRHSSDGGPHRRAAPPDIAAAGVHRIDA